MNHPQEARTPFTLAASLASLVVRAPVLFLGSSNQLMSCNTEVFFHRNALVRKLWDLGESDRVPYDISPTFSIQNLMLNRQKGVNRQTHNWTVLFINLYKNVSLSPAELQGLNSGEWHVAVILQPQLRRQKARGNKFTLSGRDLTLRTKTY